MKKKIVFSLLIILMMFSLTGCMRLFNNRFGRSNNGNGGRLYQRVSLMDKGVDMFDCILPSGWTATISSENVMNSVHPFVETVVITNPDKTAKITILSQHSYTDNSRFQEGQNMEYYTTYLHQMDASTYMDYFMSKIYPGATYVKDIDVDSKIIEQLKTLHELKLNMAYNDVNTLNPSAYNLDITIGDEGYTSTKREYQNGDTYYEASTSVSAISTNLVSGLSSLLNSRAVQWYMPYVVIYEAIDKDSYDTYYDDYNFIMANATFTEDYYAMVEYVSSAIVNVYTSYYAEKSKAALDATNSYIDSNYSSDSSASTQDKVREMWDDVIKEEDKYTLEDGSTIKTSIHNDTVAQNGNEIYIGSKGGIPYGFTELEKGY